MSEERDAAKREIERFIRLNAAVATENGRLREALEQIRKEVGTSTRTWHRANQARTGERCSALERGE